MDDQEKIFSLIAAAQENQQTINTLLAQLDIKTATIRKAEATLIQAARDAIDEATSKSLSNEKKQLGEAVINAEMTFKDLRPASGWDYFLGALAGGLVVALVMTSFFYWLIKSGGIGQPSIDLDADKMGQYVIDHLPKQNRNNGNNGSSGNNSNTNKNSK